MRLLLFSNSTNAGGTYLGHAMPAVSSFLGAGVKRVTFIPFAGVDINPVDYSEKIAALFQSAGYKVEMVPDDPTSRRVILEAEAIVVGGGNTFMLLGKIEKWGLKPIIRERVLAGIPYIGWSAGANLTCPGIYTTNDMPVIATRGLGALSLVPFQINPHFTELTLAGHAGESRETRIGEFIALHRKVYVAGLREGTWFRFEHGQLTYHGNKPLLVFVHGRRPMELNAGDDIAFLLKKPL